MLRLLCVAACAGGCASAPSTSPSRATAQAPVAFDPKPTRERARAFPAVSAELERRLSALLQERAKVGHGWIMIGQVRLADQGADPRDVFAQMEILDQGFFVGLLESAFEPVTFVLDGYEPARVDLEKTSDDLVADVGTITLSPIAPDQSARIVGRLQDTAGAPIANAAVSLLFDGIRMNTVNGGFSPRPTWNDTAARTDANGYFETRPNLVPIARYLYCAVPGFEQLKRKVELRPGQLQDLGTVELHRMLQIRVRYRVATTPDFRNSPTQETVVKTGTHWRAGPPHREPPPSYVADLSFEQAGSGVSFRAFYQPASLGHLGEKGLQRYAETANPSVELENVSRVPFRDGHTYLLDQRSAHHWVLFEVQREASGLVQGRGNTAN